LHCKMLYGFTGKVNDSLGHFVTASSLSVGYKHVEIIACLFATRIGTYPIIL
jgi:hypothetical protein